jgi:trimeric autotransporter adhesin
MLISRLIKRHIAGMMKKLFLLSVFYLLFFTAQAQIITTIAGNGTAGYLGDNGPAISAELNLPTAVAIDTLGNLYIADYLNNRIRKVNAFGNITTIAGNGTAGYNGDGGPATAAELNSPTGIAIDAIGNIYIADHLNSCVRKINTSGIIVTYAGDGSGLSGYTGDGGAATLARLSLPATITVDATGNMFIAENDNSVIRKVNYLGIISTVAGNGTSYYGADGVMATATTLDGPWGVAVDAMGNLYIADNNTYRIRKVNATGIITTIAGTGVTGFSGDGGPATAAQLSSAAGLALDKFGNVYFTDVTNDRIRKINPGGIISTVAGGGTFGLGDNGPATAARLYFPSGITFDKDCNLYIADMHNNRVRYVKSTVFVNPLYNAVGQIKVFPNPNNGNFEVNLSTNIDEQINICVIDITGKKVKDIEANSNTPVLFRLNNESIHTGIYFLQVTTCERRWIENLIISE